MTRLLTPAPQYHGQIGKLGNRTYRGDYHAGRLIWRHIPIWDLLHQLEIRSTIYLGAAYVKLNILKGHR